MAALRFTFARWCERTLGTTEPAKVGNWFRARGLDAPRQTWRKLLLGPPRSCHMPTWLQICEAANEPLSTFLQITPSGNCKPKAHFRPGTRKTPKPTAKPGVEGLPVPPRPSEFFRRLGDA